MFLPKVNFIFLTKDTGAFKVTVDLEYYEIDVDALVDKRIYKLPFQRDDNTFTIVASRSHMSPETEDYVQQMKDKHGEVNLNFQR